LKQGLSFLKIPKKKISRHFLIFFTPKKLLKKSTKNSESFPFQNSALKRDLSHFLITQKVRMKKKEPKPFFGKIIE